MSNLLYRTRLFRFATLLLGVMEFSAPAAAHSDIAIIRQELMDSVGGDYVAARDIALSLPASELSQLLLVLEAAEHVSQDRVLASILRFRLDHSAIAAEFDAHLQEAIANPDMRHQSGEPRYFLRWWPTEQADLDPLAFEAILKLPLPNDAGGARLRTSFISRVDHPDSANINMWLYAVKSKGLGYASQLAHVAKDDPAGQTRITPILVQLHKDGRMQGQTTAAGVLYTLASFGTQLQLDSLLEIKAFEQLHLAAEGLSPWSDENCRQELIDARISLRQAERELLAAEREAEPQTAINAINATIQQCEQQVDNTTRRFEAKQLWDNLEEVIEKLESQLNPPGSP